MGSLCLSRYPVPVVMPCPSHDAPSPWQAGLVSPETPEQLLIALEPEAASIYCRKLRLHQLIELSCKPQPNGLAPDHAIDSSFRQGERSRGRAWGGCCRVGGPGLRGAQGLFPESPPAPPEQPGLGAALSRAPQLHQGPPAPSKGGCCG